MVMGRQLVCPECGSRDDHTIQFHFGYCRVHEYEVGDKIIWGSSFENGEPGHRLVVTHGTTITACSDNPDCPGPSVPGCDADSFDIFIEEDVITHVRWATGEFRFYAEPYRNDSHFFVLDDYPPGLRPRNERDTQPGPVVSSPHGDVQHRSCAPDRVPEVRDQE
ncbi:hypothetical protein LV75_000222 [Actinokineospora diospyrosa]|uniref:Uncharacterized protein n=2 Tax=Actinokineospora diospyrosa TaxID=103728 RepID=A0ABT1I556_9PSEU|nr:hypothetical protein [Actinokineospora diospyrosa]